MLNKDSTHHFIKKKLYIKGTLNTKNPMKDSGEYSNY